jgi:hypothetical protein
MTRPLAVTLQELLDSFQPAAAGGGAVLVTAVSLDLPLEVALARRLGQLEFRADLPGWRWPTVFDTLRSRLRITLGVNEE